MAGVNHTDADASVRLVPKGGGFGDFLLPANSAVLLRSNLDIDRAVMFDASCQEIGTIMFGGPQDAFSEGGQVYVGPKNEGGITSEQLAQAAPPASPTDACANVPTPADPRNRVPLGGGGVEMQP